MKENELTHGEIVIVQIPHQKPPIVLEYDSKEDAFNAFAEENYYREYDNKAQALEGLDEENDEDIIENIKKKTKNLPDDTPIIEWSLGGDSTTEFCLNSEEERNEILDAFIADDMHSSFIFEAEENETYLQFEKRIFEKTRGHNEPSYTDIRNGLGTDEVDYDWEKKYSEAEDEDIETFLDQYGKISDKISASDIIETMNQWGRPVMKDELGNIVLLEKRYPDKTGEEDKDTVICNPSGLLEEYTHADEILNYVGKETDFKKKILDKHEEIKDWLVEKEDEQNRNDIENSKSTGIIFDERTLTDPWNRTFTAPNYWSYEDIEQWKELSEEKDAEIVSSLEVPYHAAKILSGEEELDSINNLESLTLPQRIESIEQLISVEKQDRKYAWQFSRLSEKDRAEFMTSDKSIDDFIDEKLTSNEITTVTIESEEEFNRWEETTNDITNNPEKLYRAVHGGEYGTEEMIDDGIEQLQANGGMREAAMEEEIAAQENPRPDYLDEQGNPHWFDEEEEEIEMLSDEEITRLKEQNQQENLSQYYEQFAKETEGRSEAVQLQRAIALSLDKNVSPLVEVKLNRENWNKLFPEGIVETPIGVVKLGENQFEKLQKSNRNNLLGAMYETLSNPSIVLEKETLDEKTGEFKPVNVYGKSFVHEYTNHKRAVESVIIFKYGENISIGTHNKNIKDFVKQIKTADQVIFADSEISRVASLILQNGGSHVRLQDALATEPFNPNYNKNNLLSIKDLKFSDAEEAPKKEQNSSLEQPVFEKIDEKTRAKKILSDISNVLDEGTVYSAKNNGENIELRRGQKHTGLIHIITRRYEEKVLNKKVNMSPEQAMKEITALSYLIADSLDKGEMKQTPKGNWEINLNGIQSIITKDRNGKFVLTGYEFNDTIEAARSSINAVIAQYGNTPEFLGVYAQVGAALTSYNYSINQSNSPVNEMTDKANSSSLEQSTLEKAADLLKGMNFNSENYRDLLEVINKISEMNGLENLAVPKEERIQVPDTQQQTNPAEVSNRDAGTASDTDYMDSEKIVSQEKVPDNESELFNPDDTTYDTKRLSDKDYFAAAWQERNMPFLKNEYTDTYKKEFPELVKMGLMPDVSFIAETMKKHPEYTDFNNKYIREGIDIMRTPDERLNPYTKFTKHIMEYAYAQKKLEDDNFKTYTDLAEKNIAEQLSAKEAELDRREAEVEKEMERLKKAQKQTQNILSNFNKIIKKEGEFNIDLPYMFRGLSKEQTQNVWKTLGKICDQKRSDNAAKESNENTNKKTDEKDGSNTGSKR